MNKKSLKKISQNWEGFQPNRFLNSLDISKRPEIMQRKKHEQFPTPMSGDGRPTNISRVHIPQSHVLNTASMKRYGGGEFHLYRTAYTKFTTNVRKKFLPQNMLIGCYKTHTQEMNLFLTLALHQFAD